LKIFRFQEYKMAIKCGYEVRHPQHMLDIPRYNEKRGLFYNSSVYDLITSSFTPYSYSDSAKLLQGSGSVFKFNGETWANEAELGGLYINFLLIIR